MIRQSNRKCGAFTFSITTYLQAQEHSSPAPVAQEPVPEMKVVSDHIFTKSKSNALTSETFNVFIREHGISEFYIVGADATACIKSTASI